MERLLCADTHIICITLTVFCFCTVITRAAPVTDREHEGFKVESVAKHVVHIGVDGLKPACIANSSDGSPNIYKRLVEKGAFTFTNARTTIQTVSAPGWSTTLCAMDPTSTGVTTNSWTPPWLGNTAQITPVTGNKSPFPCVFETIKDQNPAIRTASFYDWNWIQYLMNPGNPGHVDHDFFCDPTKTNYHMCDSAIAGNASDYLKQLFQSEPDKSSYTFIYFGNVDETGHSYGWCGSQYESEVSTIDGHIGQILDVVDQAGKSEETLVMLSADHGGEGYGHGNPDNACLIIPMIIRGPSVKKNYELQISVRNMDMVPTGLYALGLQPNQWWKGLIMKEAFEI